MKKKILSLALALALTISLAPAAFAAEGDLVTAPAPDPAPFFEFNTDLTGNGMNSKAVGIYDAEYAQYFDDDGIYGVVTDGNFYINDFQVPASAEEFAALEGGFVVNTGAKLAMTMADGKFKVGKSTCDTYEDAIKALVHDQLPGGLHYELYDNNADSKADVVKLWFTEGVIVNEITKDADGNYILSRGDLAIGSSNAGRLYDGNSFAAESVYGEVIKPENFDTEIEAGDCAIFYKTPDGWVVKKAIEVNGILTDGSDHHYYEIDGVQYPDTMKYSRDNLIVAQRNGEFYNAHNFFGFKGNDDGLKVSLWMDTFSGAPIGLSANENAKTFLADAIAQSKAIFAAVTLTDSATAEQKFAYAALEEAIKNAEATLADETSYNSEYDFYTYYLYLALAGTGSDIGAAFSGFFANKEFGWEKMNAFPGFVALFDLEDGALIAEIDTQRVGGGGMGKAVGIYDYPQFFDADGVYGVVTAGNFYINDFQVPANPEALAALGENGFVVNSGAIDLKAADGQFKVGKDAYDKYEDAIYALVHDELPGGLHIDLYDADYDGLTDIVKLWYTEGLVVNEISQDADGNYILYRGDLARVPTYAGRLYDADNFGNILGETIKPENFDTDIEVGEACIFYLTPDGWVVEAAHEANGILVEGIDHDYYQIDDTKYVDTMKYSRDNLIVANRNGELTNAHTYFGFKNNDDGLKVSMWMDTKSWSPIGITSNDNAAVFLADAIAQAKAKLAAVDPAKAVTDDQKLAYAALEEAIKLAEETLADETSYNSEMDFYVYYLYLTLNGTGNDIGAAFAGFYGVNGWGFKNAYPGFDALFASADEEYTVAAGDCLWNLAVKFYGKGTEYTKIVEANGIKNADLIYVGQKLVIPG